MMTERPNRIDLAGVPEALTALLYRHDPVQIAYQTNADEYQPEAAHILTRLQACQSPADVCQVVHQELVRSFGVEAVGAADQYQQLAQETWALWQESRRPA